MASTQRFSLAPLIRYHYASFRTPGTTRTSLGTRLVLFGLPAVAGALVALTAPVPASSPLGIVATTSGTMVAGFLAAFVLFTNLRIKLQESIETLPQTSNLRCSVSTAVVSSIYLMLASAATLLAAVAGALYWDVLAVGGARAFLGLIIALFVHIAVTSLTVVRRAASAYILMFRGEVVPTKLRAVDDDHRRVS